jgi:PAS domain S-box-containing protein
MKHLRTRLTMNSSSHAPSRSVSRHNWTKTIESLKPATHSGEPIHQCYRALLETSSSAILLLSPTSIILGWNRGAETASGWIADEALGRNYAELCLPTKARDSFLSILAQAIEGREVKGFKSPLRTRLGSQVMLSWNITRVLGTRADVLGLMAIGTAVVPDIQVKEDLRLAHTRLRSAARRAQKAVEEERRRIARELHDEFGQSLTGLKFDLARLGMTLTQSHALAGGGDLLGTIQSMSGSVDALLASIRATAAALRPAMLDDLGLVPALECLATTFEHRTGVRCAIDVAAGLSSIALPPEVSAALFRIAQELLTNVMRHAVASQVRMRLYQDSTMVTLEVTDNGKGITRERTTTPHAFGLRGMQERASLLGGYFHIVGTSGIGTTAIASVPAAECFTS